METSRNKLSQKRTRLITNGNSHEQKSNSTTFQLVDERPIHQAHKSLIQLAQKDNAYNLPENRNGGLPPNLKTGVEQLSGYSMNDVSVYYNSAKPAQLNAYAFAIGTDIHLGPGQEKHLPHEAWHVVQQKQRRVKKTLQLNGIPVNDDPRLEAEADIYGRKALNSSNGKRGLKKSEPHFQTTVQMKGESEALGSITSGSTEMRRGNTESVSKTEGVSSFWVSYVRKNKAKIKEKAKEFYLSTAGASESRFDDWYSKREFIIEGLVYKHLQYGNCGEFAKALYGELQQTTSDQYLYHGSYFREANTDQFDGQLSGFRAANTNVRIKSKDSDHAFVVTYPTLAAKQEIQFVNQRDIKQDQPHPKPIKWNIYPIAGIDPELAMVADGWLDRKVTTLKDKNFDDSSVVLTAARKAGENLIDPTLVSKIAAWAEQWKRNVQAAPNYRSAVASHNTDAVFAFPSNYGTPAEDSRPKYIKAIHGKESEKVQNFEESWTNDKNRLISFFKKTSPDDLMKLGRLIYGMQNPEQISRFSTIYRIATKSEPDYFRIAELPSEVVASNLFFKATTIDIQTKIKEFNNKKEPSLLEDIIQLTTEWLKKYQNDPNKTHKLAFIQKTKIDSENIQEMMIKATL